MSERKKRKVHTPEFKAKVGLEALRGASTANRRSSAVQLLMKSNAQLKLGRFCLDSGVHFNRTIFQLRRYEFLSGYRDFHESNKDKTRIL